MLTDRIARLPGITPMLTGIENFKIIELESGCAALGIFRFENQLIAQQPGDSAPFLTTRPRPAEDRISESAPRATSEDSTTANPHPIPQSCISHNRKAISHRP